MDMAKRRLFLNFEVSEELMAKLDASAKQSGWDRSKQARALLEYALGIEAKPREPYIPARMVTHSFRRPAHRTPSPRKRVTV